MRTKTLKAEPFVGRAGRFLDDMLSRVGLTRGQVFVTNSVKCRPPRNRAPRRDELQTCRAYWLDRQIDLVQPRLVVLLGSAAIRQMFGRKPQLSKEHGHVRAHDGRRFLLAYHPASAMRFPQAGKAMNEDLRVLRRLVAKVV